MASDDARTSSTTPGHGGDRLDVLVIGGGGRDHALCHAFSTSPRLRTLHAAPGNAGIADIGTCHPGVDPTDTAAVLELVRELRPDLVVVGAEDLLVAGLASEVQALGVRCLGPTRAAARLEGSKLFAKELMERAGIATPAWRACATVAEAHAAIEEFDGQVAVKADGLAAGCGAYVCTTEQEAHAAVRELLVERRFGDSGARLVVEQLVAGEEASVMAVVDGEHIVPLPAARDYKRLRDGDTGPNTGGMGAHVPSAAIDAATAESLAREVIGPVVDALRAEGSPFRGVVYAGVMLTDDGPQVLEYNCRFGNPETQALVRVADCDLLDLLDRAAGGSLADVEAVSARGAAVSACVAAASYPELQLEPEPVLVHGLDAARAVPGVELFLGLSDRVDAGADSILALGGRVVTVSAWGVDLETAVTRANAAAALVQVPGRQQRRDIGRRAVEHLRMVTAR